MQDTPAVADSTERIINQPRLAQRPQGMALHYSRLVQSTKLAILLTLIPGPLLFGQSVSPEIEIRTSTITGSALEATAAFEAGATYVAWRDTRSEGNDGDIYAQRLGPDGQPLWMPNGLAICVAANRQSLPAITSDGAGGAVVTWLDKRSNPGAIYAQRISASGAVQWALNGVFVGLVYVEEPYSYVHRAPNGGFSVTWWDSAPFADTDKFPVLAQRLDANGTRLWDPGQPDTQDFWGSGIEVINGITRGRSAPDGAGGFIVFGKVRREKEFRFQRVLANGSAAWSKPVNVDAAWADTVSFNFAPDGGGGVIVAFLDDRDVKAFRVAGDGTLPWGPDAVTLVQANSLTGQSPFVAPNGTGGAFVAWTAGTPHDVRVQQIAANGSLLWVAGGVFVPDGSNTEREPVMITDGDGGVFLSFTTSTSLRGQGLDRTGSAQWKINGSNGVGLGSGDLPIMGAGISGPTIVYRRSRGLSAKSVLVSAPVRLTEIGPAGGNQVSFRLSGGVPGRSYDILRATSVAPFSNIAWKVVGTAQAGQIWTDTNPILPMAFYGARERSP